MVRITLFINDLPMVTADLSGIGSMIRNLVSLHFMGFLGNNRFMSVLHTTDLVDLFAYLCEITSL